MKNGTLYDIYPEFPTNPEECAKLALAPALIPIAAVEAQKITPDFKRDWISSFSLDVAVMLVN